MLDSNTHYLNSYEHNQSLLEQQWELSLPEKQEAVIDYAIKIMEGLVSNEEFNYVFSEFYEDSDDDGDIYTNDFNEARNNWLLGNSPEDELEAEMLWKIAHSSLEGASQLLYDTEFESLFDNLGAATKKVLSNDN